MTPMVDVVTVAYNSADELRRCVEPLAAERDIAVVVVDNASVDGSLETVSDLDVTTIRLQTNGGFAHGCNVGWRHATSPYVLFLNPDAEIAPEAVRALAKALDDDESVGAVAPRILAADGSLAFSLRRSPSVARSFSQALFLHRVFPHAAWSDETVRDRPAYERPWSPDWVSGACILVRRPILEEIGGWDERFFLYREDADLCRRIRAAGHDVRFTPAAECRHIEGASSTSDRVPPRLAASRIRYSAKHDGRLDQALVRIALVLSSATHALAGRSARRGHLRALGVCLTTHARA